MLILLLAVVAITPLFEQVVPRRLWKVAVFVMPVVALIALGIARTVDEYLWTIGVALAATFGTGVVIAAIHYVRLPIRLVSMRNVLEPWTPATADLLLSPDVEEMLAAQVKLLERNGFTRRGRLTRRVENGLIVAEALEARGGREWANVSVALDGSNPGTPRLMPPNLSAELEGGGRLVVTGERRRNPFALRRELCWELPSVSDMEMLVRVFYALIDRLGPAVDDPDLADAGFAARTSARTNEQVRELTSRGFLRADPSRGAVRFTAVGVLLSSVFALPPFREFFEYRILRRERRLLRELGISASAPVASASEFPEPDGDRPAARNARRRLIAARAVTSAVLTASVLSRQPIPVFVLSCPGLIKLARFATAQAGRTP